jgi:hypothetical protein
VRWARGMIYAATALLTGYATLYQILQTANGGPWSWWYPIMLGGSILLVVGDIREIVPKLNSLWLVALSALIPLALCGILGGLPLRCWAFGIGLGFIAWIGLAVGSTTRQLNFLTLASSLTLLASWLPMSVRTFRVYLSSGAPSSNATVLLPLFLTWVLLIATVALSSSVSLRNSRT